MKIGVLGAGSWGLTLSWLWAQPGKIDTATVWLWDRKPEKMEALRRNRKISFPVALEIPESVILIQDIAAELHDTDVIVLAVTADAGLDRSAVSWRKPDSIRKSLSSTLLKGLSCPRLNGSPR